MKAWLSTAPHGRPTRLLKGVAWLRLRFFDVSRTSPGLAGVVRACRRSDLPAGGTARQDD